MKSLTCYPTGDARIAERAEPVRRGCPELPVHTIQRARQRRVRDRRSSGATADNTLKAQHPHEPLDRTAGDIEALPTELAPDLPDPVDPEVLLPDPSDLRDQVRVPTSPGTGPRWVATGGGMDMICRRGDRQNPADRLDPMDGAMIIDERDHLLNGRSSSA